MKLLWSFLLTTLFLNTNLVSQVALTASYVPPKFPNGPKEFSTYAQKYINYPVTASGERVQGTVDVTIYINKAGKVKLVRTAGSNVEFNNETKRVLKLSSNWEPGLRNGAAIDTMLTLKVFYCLEKDDPNATENDICIIVYRQPMTMDDFEKDKIEEKQRYVKMTNAKKLNEEGSQFMQSKQYEEAIKKFSEAILIAGNVNSFLYNRGLAYLNLKQDDKAKADFLEAYRKGDEDSGKIYNDLFK